MTLYLSTGSCLITKLYELKHMKRLTILLTTLLCLMMGSNPQAAVVEDLYSVELVVSDQTTSQRLSIFKQAFREAIAKVSGSTTVVDNPGFKGALYNSSRYVLQFRYLTPKDVNRDASGGGKLILRVVFNQGMIENLLRENNIAIWGKERPSTLLLISYDVNNKASIVSSDTTSGLVDELDELAHRQGLPVLFPMLDLEDRRQMGVRDIIQTNTASMDALTLRYSPDAVLSGQIIGLDGKDWKGIWQVRFSNQLFNWTFKAGSRQQIMQQAITQLAQTLANEYALETYQAIDQRILFTVDRITQLADHIKVLSYLQTLDAIESARLVLINEDRVTYRVKLRNTAKDLSRLISLGYVLEQLELPQINAATDDQTVLMNYRYIQ